MTGSRAGIRRARWLAALCALTLAGAASCILGGPDTDTERATSTTFPSVSGTRQVATPPVPTATTTAEAAGLDNLDDTEWILTAVGDTPAADGFVTRLRFVNRVDMSATIACNSMGARYLIDGSRITLIEGIQRTWFSCESTTDPEGHGESVFEALEELDTFRASEKVLEFFDGSGDRLLSFIRFEPPPLDPRLAGDWVVVELKGIPILEGTRIMLGISQEGVGGIGGCNEFGGRRSPFGTGLLSIEGIWSTEVGCIEPPGVLAQEASFLNALRNAVTFQITYDTLELMNDFGATDLVLIRIPQYDMDPADLVGTSWRLVSLGAVELQPDAEFTIEFTADGEVRGNNGCWNTMLTYIAAGDKIRATSGHRLEDISECDEDQSFRAERFSSALGGMERYRLYEDRLEILNSDGVLLLFEPFGE